MSSLESSLQITSYCLSQWKYFPCMDPEGCVGDKGSGKLLGISPPTPKKLCIPLKIIVPYAICNWTASINCKKLRTEKMLSEIFFVSTPLVKLWICTCFLYLKLKEKWIKFSLIINKAIFAFLRRLMTLKLKSVNLISTVYHCLSMSLSMSSTLVKSA